MRSYFMMAIRIIISVIFSVVRHLFIKEMFDFD